MTHELIAINAATGLLDEAVIVHLNSGTFHYLVISTKTTLVML
jgi:hypothetical protein